VVASSSVGSWLIITYLESDMVRVTVQMVKMASANGECIIVSDNEIVIAETSGGVWMFGPHELLELSKD